MKFNLDSALRTPVAAQGYHGYRYIVEAHEVSQLNWPEAELVQDRPN